jgi:small subunit ribosomal protein S17
MSEAAKEQVTVERGQPKVREGFVVSDKMTKTAVVAITTKVKHPAYGKYVNRTRRYLAHDEQNECKIGDLVRIVESRPLSKNKRWKVQSVIVRGEE